MIEALAEPFERGLLQRAVLELLILATVCGPLGVWILLFRQSYAAESIAHAMLPGLVIATLLGLPLALGAAGGVLAAAGAVALAGRDERIGSDLGVGVTITALFGAGALLALIPDAPARLEEVLFGDLLGVSGGDLAVTAGLGAAVLTALALAHRSLTLSAFEPGTARALGTLPGRGQLVLLILLALTLVAAVQALGNLLVVALIIAPAAAALRLARRLGAALALSVALAACAGVAGIYVSYYLDLAGGASVALVAVLIFAATLPAGRGRGGAAPGPGGSPVRAVGAD